MDGELRPLQISRERRGRALEMNRKEVGGRETNPSSTDSKRDPGPWVGAQSRPVCVPRGFTC